MTNFKKVEATDTISNTGVKNLLFIMPKKEEEVEHNFFLDNQTEETDDGSLSPEEYMKKLQKEKQESDEVMQLVRDWYWVYLMAEAGDPDAIEKLQQADLGDRHYLSSADQANFDDIVSIVNKGKENITVNYGSMDKEAGCNRLLEKNEGMTKAQAKEYVDEISSNCQRI